MDEVKQKRLAKLKKIRTRKDLKLKKSGYLKDTFTTFGGDERELRLRYYQIQGVLHLLAVSRFILGDGTGLGKCVTGDTLLRTDLGLIPISSLAPKPLEQLTPGNFYDPAFPVKVWNGSKWADVKRFYYDGLRSTKKIRTSGGYAVEGSHRHPLKVRGEKGEDWKRTPDIQVGDYLLVDRKEAEWSTDPEIVFTNPSASNAKEYTTPSKMTPDLARLLGYIVAEGHCPDQWHINVSQHDPEPHKDIRRLFKAVFGWEGNHNNAKRDVNIEVTSRQIRSFLETCGIGSALSKDKVVPPLVMRSSRESVVEFLRGYFEGEGHALPCGGVEISSASKRLLREVHLLLLQLGITSVLKPKKVKGRSHTYWRLSFFSNDARLFQDRIGFISQRKRSALEMGLERQANPNRDVVPHSRDMVEALRGEIYARCGRHGFKGGGITKIRGESFYSTLKHIRSGKRSPTYRFLREMLEVGVEVGVPEDHPAMAHIQAVVEQNAFYDQVEFVEEGFAEVMDIEVDDPSHCFVGNGLVNHNTLQSIAALCYTWDRNPDVKALVLTNKSAVPQWVGEFSKFTAGVNAILCRGTPKQRQKAYDEFNASKGPTVLVMGYRSAVQDFQKLQDVKWGCVIYDEASAFKNPKTKIHQVCRHFSGNSDRTWGLTATLIKNRLEEGWGIYQVIAPGLFHPSHSRFMSEFCVTRMQRIKGSRRQIPIVVGHRKDQIARFREMIEPYFIGRPKHEVAAELPPLTSKTIKFGMTRAQSVLYNEALSGLLEVLDKETGEFEEKEVSQLTSIIYCQQIVNHPLLIGHEGDSTKLNTLMELLTEGDLEGEKVIVFSRFRTMVDIIMEKLRAKKVKAVRITGSEDEDQRKASQDAFQNPKDDTKVICITTAATEAVNLQAAKAIIFFDTPWSAGDYLQALGRMIRIGSEHDSVYAFHLVCQDSIDERVQEVRRSKMRLIESVLGKRLKGDADDVEVSVSNEIGDLFSALQQDARRRNG